MDPKKTATKANPADTTKDDASGPRTVQMPRAVHELRTGRDPEDKIDSGTVITDEVAAEHDLDDAAIGQLIKAGSVELVDVLVG